MPDADKIHGSLQRRYSRVYQQVCEDLLDAEELAHAVLNAVKKDLQHYGNTPIRFIRRAANILGQIPKEPLLKELVDWAQVTRVLERMHQDTSRRTAPNVRAIHLALEASKDQLYELQQSDAHLNLNVSILNRYGVRIYETNFEERLPLTQKPDDSTQFLINERTQDMRAPVERGLKKFAEQLDRHGDVTKLHRPPRTRVVNPPALDEDLLSVGVWRA